MVERNGVFDDVEFFVADISNAYRNQMFTDVTFVLSDGVAMKTNRFMLAWRSQYFASKLLALKEDDAKVVMNCDSKIFQILLDYMWEGRVDLSNLKLQQLLDLMENAQMMCLERLVGNVQEYLSYLLEFGQLELNEYWAVLQFCSDKNFGKILVSAMKFIETNFNTICSSKTNFVKLSKDTIVTLFKKENRTVGEIDIFKALTIWLDNQPYPVEDSTKAALLGLVDLAAVSPVDLLRVVRKSGFYKDMDICDAFEKQLSIKNEKGGADKIDQTSNGRVRSRSSNVEEKVSHMRGSWGNSRHSYLSPSLPQSLLEIRREEEVYGGVGEGEVEEEDGSEEEEGIRYKKHAEDYRSLPRQDEALEEDTVDKYEDEKASPRRANTLVKWWRSRDSLLSPKAL